MLTDIQELYIKHCSVIEKCAYICYQREDNTCSGALKDKWKFVI